MSNEPGSTRKKALNRGGPDLLTPKRAEEMKRVGVTFRRLQNDDVDVVIAPATVAGLETVILCVVTPGGLVPLFAHLSPDILQVLSLSLAQGDFAVTGRH